MTGTQAFNRSGPSWAGSIGDILSIAVTNAVTSGGGVHVTVEVQQQKQQVSPLASIRTDQFTAIAGFTTTRYLAIDRFADAINVRLTAQGGTGVSSVSFELDVFCEADVSTDLSEVLAAVRRTYSNA